MNEVYGLIDRLVNNCFSKLFFGIQIAGAISCAPQDPLYEDLNIQVPEWKDLYSVIKDSTSQRLKDQAQRDTLTIDWNDSQTQSIIKWTAKKMNAEFHKIYDQEINKDKNFILTIPADKIGKELSKARFNIVNLYNDQLKYNITLHNAIYHDGTLDSATYKGIEETRKINPCYYPPLEEIKKRKPKQMRDQQRKAQTVINKALWIKPAAPKPRNHIEDDNTPKG